MGLFDNLDPVEGLSSSNMFADLPKEPGFFRKGLEQGKAAVVGGAGGVLALGARMAGAKPLEEKGLEIARRAEEDAAPYAFDVRDISSVKEAAGLVPYALGALAPFVGARVVGGLAGGLIGRLVSGTTKGRNIGAVTGALGVSAGLSAGSIFPEALDNKVDDPVMRSVVGGTVSGLLDQVAPAAVLRRAGMLGKTAGGSVGGVKGAAAGAVKGFFGEGVTEVGQEAVERGAGGQAVTGDEALGAYINAGVVGGIGGGALGGAGGAFKARSTTPASAPNVVDPLRPAVPTPAAAPEEPLAAQPTAPQAPIGEPLPSLDLPEGSFGNIPVAAPAPEAQPLPTIGGLQTDYTAPVTAAPTIADETTARLGLPRIFSDPRIAPYVDTTARAKLAEADTQLQSAPERTVRDFLEPQLLGAREAVVRLEAEAALASGARGRKKQDVARELALAKSKVAGLDRAVKTLTALEASRGPEKTGSVALGQVLDIDPRPAPTQLDVSPLELETLRVAASAAPAFDRTAREVAVLQGDTIEQQPVAPESPVMDIVVPEPDRARSRIIYDSESRAAEEASRAIEEASPTKARQGVDLSAQAPAPAQGIFRGMNEAAQIDGIRARRAAGELLSTDDVRALRLADKEQPPPVVEEPQAPAEAPTLNLPTVYSSSRGVQRDVPPQQRIETFVDNANRSIEARTAEMVSLGAMKGSTAVTVRTALRSVFQQASAATSGEEASAIIRAGAARVLKGKVRAEDSTALIDSILRDAIGGVDPNVIEGTATRVEERATRLLGAATTKLSDAETSALEAHYGASRATPEFNTRLRSDVLAYIQRGASAVAQKVRAIIKKVVAAVVAIGVTFNSGQFNSEAQAFNMPVPKTKTEFTRVIQKPKADFGKVKPSVAAATVADWAVGGKDAGGKPFVVVDKSSATAYTFSGDGKLISAAPVLIGSAAGDVISQETMNKTIEATTAAEKITPAGRFDATYRNDNLIFAEGEQSVIAMHKVYLGTPSERRQQRLDTASPADNRVSYGCINVSAAYMKNVIEPTFKDSGGVMYITPDSQTLNETFAGLAGYDPQYTVTNEFINDPTSAENVAKHSEQGVLRTAAGQKRARRRPGEFFSDAAVGTPVVRFTHWGNVPGGVTDPKKLGSGVRGRDWEAALEFGTLYTSAVVEGTNFHEPAVQVRTKYSGELSADKVYDATNYRQDPRWPAAQEKVRERYGPDFGAAMAQFQKDIVADGYDAILFANGQLRIFSPVKVTRADANSRTSTDPADISRQVDAEYEAKGMEAIAQLARMLGAPSDLEVRLFVQRQEGGFAGRYRTTPLKDVIELAYNAKDILSLAAHEGFHRIETKHLGHAERTIIRKGLAKNSALYKQLMDKARAYDAANGTQVAEEIDAIPQEAHAYGFEFWKRGELKVGGALERVFRQIRQLLERVRNYIDGLGFRSIEDVYRAIDMGAYAMRDGPLTAKNVAKLYDGIDGLESRANVEQDAGWKVIDGTAGTLREEDAKRIIKLRVEGNSVVRPSEMWANYELRAVEDQTNPGMFLVEARKRTPNDRYSKAAITAVSKMPGRPHWVKRPADVTVMRQRLEQLAFEGQRGRNWHAESAGAILEWAGYDIRRAATMAALISNFSPRTPVGLDLKKALAMLAKWEGADIKVGAPEQHIASAVAILRRDGEFDEIGNPHPGGIKRQNFFRNLMLGIDPAHYSADEQGATIDMWMAHAFGYANDAAGSVSKTEYLFADREVKLLAREMGWQVEETQAAIWVAIKARGNAARSTAQKTARKKGWMVPEKESEVEIITDLYGEVEVGKINPKTGKRFSLKYVIADDKQREYVEMWMALAMQFKPSYDQFAKANYNYANAFRDIRNGVIAMPEGIEEYSDKDAAQDVEGKAAPLQFFSKASLDQVSRRAQAGEVQHTQLMASVAQALDEANLPAPTYKALFDATVGGAAGNLKRGYLTTFSSGMNAARNSLGFKNVFGVVTAHTQRKNRLIADGVESKLSRWLTAATPDVEAASKALLDRTVGGYAAGSPEWDNIVDRLTQDQRALFDQATAMVADRLRLELEADTRTMSRSLGADSAAFKEWLENRTTQVEGLIRDGYVPERRYGDYTVTIKAPTLDPSGMGKDITVFHEQYESEAEATIMRQRYMDALSSVAPDLKISQGYRYSPDHDASLSFQQFLDMARRFNIDVSQAEKERLAKAMISADSVRRNRMFRRKNVPGYSTDALRVLSEFGVTMANKIAYSEFSESIGKAQNGTQMDITWNNGAPVIEARPGTDLWAEDGPSSGFYRNLSDKTVDYVMGRQDDSAWSRTARAAATLNFLGGSLAAGAVQLSSLPIVSAPYLSAHTGYLNAVSKLGSAFSTTVRNTGVVTNLAKLEDLSNEVSGVDEVPGLRNALIQAARDGTTLDTEIYQIMGMTRGGMLAKSRNVRRFMEGWMLPFRKTEQWNRAATFIAAYNIGIENKLGGADLYKFAQDAVYNTQFRYDEANRPAIARNPIWAVMFTFKSYPVFMTEALVALAKEKPQAAVIMLLSLAVSAGVEGLPFAEDIMDLVDTISQRIFGSSFNSQRALRNVAKSASEAVVGVDLSALFARGVLNSVTELNIASRVGMGDLIPGTRLGAADADFKRVAEEIIGPVGGMVGGWGAGAGALLKGNFAEAFSAAAPTGLKNLGKGWSQWDKGHATDAGGRKLVDVSGIGALFQSIGFAPAAVAHAYDLDRIDKRSVSFYNSVRDDFTKEFVKAIKDSNTGRIAELTQALMAWNTAHPEAPIPLSATSLRRRLVEAGMSLNERTLKSLPRQLRGGSEALGVTTDAVE